MKIVVLGDLHLVSPDEPDEARRERRRHFATAWPTFKAMAQCVRRQAPDLVVSLGDLVDWYSDANRDFALSCMDELGTPWLMTPGNHDLSYPAMEDCPRDQRQARAREGWVQAGVALENRALTANGSDLLLMDSALSEVPDGTDEWLREVLAPQRQRMLFSHVPLAHPQVATYIHSVQPQRNLEKYMQHTPLLDTHLRGRVAAAFTGHLHFPGQLTVHGTEMHLLPLSVTATDTPYPGQGVATVLELTDGTWHIGELRP